jgi:hypothetical protein
MIIEKTGWTPDEISKLNIQTISLLIDTWASATDKKDYATAQDVKSLQRLLESTK